MKIAVEEGNIFPRRKSDWLEERQLLSFSIDDFKSPRHSQQLSDTCKLVWLFLLMFMSAKDQSNESIILILVSQLLDAKLFNVSYVM